jgi:arabinofuranosyltransferase
MSRSLARSPAVSLTIRPARLALTATCALSALALWAFPWWVTDDAFITLRYAENLAAGNGFVWNPGETPTEGYTGVLLPLVLAALLALGVPAVAATHAVGVTAFGAGALALHSLARTLGAGSAGRTVAVALYLLNPALVAHAFNGLETTLFTAAAVAVMLALASGSPRALALACLAASLARPDGVALSLLALGALVWRERRAIRPALAYYVLPGALYFAWRVWYYGTLLPVPFYRKAGARSDWGFVWDTLDGAAYFLALPLLACAGVWAIARLSGVRTRAIGMSPALVVGALFSLVTLAAYAGVETSLSFSWRYQAALFPLACAALALATDRAAAALAALRDTRRTLALALVVVCAFGQLTWNAWRYRGEVDGARTFGATLAGSHAPAAEFVREHTAPGDWCAAVVDAGLIPYASGRRYVDLGGLCDPFVARARDAGEVREYVYAHEPAAFTVTSLDWRTLAPAHDGFGVTADPRFAGYHLAAKFKADHQGVGWAYFQFVYLRNP